MSHLKIRHFKILSLGFFFLLTSCSTTNYYTQTVDSWRGANMNTLKKQWGTPNTEIHTRDGKTILVYQKTGSQAYNTTGSPAVGVSLDEGGRPVIVIPQGPNNTMTRGSDSLALTCTVAFVANAKGVITEAKAKGNGCYGGQSFANRMGNR